MENLQIRYGGRFALFFHRRKTIAQDFVCWQCFDLVGCLTQTKHLVDYIFYWISWLSSQALILASLREDGRIKQIEHNNLLSPRGQSKLETSRSYVHHILYPPAQLILPFDHVPSMYSPIFKSVNILHRPCTNFYSTLIQSITSCPSSPSLPHLSFLEAQE